MSELETLQTPHGPMLAFRMDQFITRCLRETGEYAPREARLLAQIARPGMTVVEVGANIGVHTVPLARGCRPGPLYAFEPQQRVFQVLCANLALNDIDNVVALPEACGAAEATATAPPIDYGQPGNFGGVSLTPPGEPGRAVRVVAIDDLALPSLGLLKIDAEGFELQVLRGAAATIARHRPVIYMENDRPDLQQETISRLDEMGYQSYWHAPAIAEDPAVFGERLVSVNMLSLPKDLPANVLNLERIDPTDWRSPLFRETAS